MKSSHRHELQTNELQKLTDRATRLFEQYGNHLLIGLSAVLLVAAGATWWVKSNQATQGARWAELAAASRAPREQQAEEYGNIADRYAGSEVGSRARLREAELHLETGVELAFSSRQEAVDSLESARESFEQLLDQQNLAEDVHERALLGYAKCLESLAGVQTEKDVAVKDAVTAYQQLVDRFPDSVFRSIAEERIAALKEKNTQEFYAWFRSQNPTREEQLGPQDVGGGQSPFGQPGASGRPAGSSGERREMPLDPSSLFPGQGGDDSSSEPSSGEGASENGSSVPALPDLPTGNKESENGESPDEEKGSPDAKKQDAPDSEASGDSEADSSESSEQAPDSGQPDDSSQQAP